MTQNVSEGLQRHRAASAGPLRASPGIAIFKTKGPVARRDYLFSQDYPDENRPIPGAGKLR